VQQLKKNIYTYRVPKSTLNTARDFADVAFNILKGRNCSAMSRVTIQEVYIKYINYTW
jgi:hypothetical protein